MKEKVKIYGWFLFMLAFLACDEIDDPFPENIGGGIIIETSDSLILDSLGIAANVEVIIEPGLDVQTSSELVNLLTNNPWGDTVIAADNSNRRFVVLEEFTGHECINCSIGTKEVVRLKDTLDEQLVPIAIHSGQFAEPRASGSMYTTDHRVEGGHGEIYQQTFNPGDEYPRGIVNRNGGLVSGVFEWEGQINDVKADLPIAKVELINYYDSTIDVLRMEINIEWYETRSEEYNLQVMVTEDNIIDWQYDLGVNKPNYNHRFVLRKVVNGTWGKSLKPATIGEIERIQYFVSLDDSWKSEDISSAVYIYNSNTNSYEVIQANSAAVK